MVFFIHICMYMMKEGCLSCFSWSAQTQPTNNTKQNIKQYKLCDRPGLRTLTETTLNNGYLGSRNDEERSEMRYVV